MAEAASEALRATGTPAAGIGSAPDPAGVGSAVPDPAVHYQRYVAEFSEKLTNPVLSGLELWMAGAAQLQRMSQPWADFVQQSFGGAGTMNGPAGAGDPLGAALERSFGLLADFPGLNNELPALLREAAGNTLALQRARESYRVIMAATWQRTFEEITREVLRRAAANEAVASPGAFLSLATSIADRVFVETFRSERYIAAQHDLSSALADQRRCEARVVDLYARSGHFPTRREHDDALREISELRRDVHALKRAVRSLAAAGPRATAPARTDKERAVASGARRNGSASEPSGTLVLTSEQPQNGGAPEKGAAGPSGRPRRRNLGKAARRPKGYPKRTDHGT
jgi:hypothetical protein